VAQADFEALLRDERVNAALAWLVVGLVVAAGFPRLVDGIDVAAVFAICIAVLAVVPAMALRNVTAMVPWEVLSLASGPVVARVLAPDLVLATVMVYFAVAALALIVAVELHAFTAIEMSIGFAIGFVVVTTLAVSGLWAVAAWLSDVLVGTTFVLDPALTTAEQERRLMWEFVGSTVAGLGAGLVFEGYVRRTVDPGARLPRELDEEA
jgi:hypothetical protein